MSFITKRVPVSYMLILVALVAAATYIVLSIMGVIPVEDLFVLMVQYTLTFFMLMVLGVVGGVFLGMVMAHRMLSAQDFTPVERLTIETHAAVKGMSEQMDVMASRLDRLEDGATDDPTAPRPRVR